MPKKISVSLLQILDWIRNPESYKTAQTIIRQAGFAQEKTDRILEIARKYAEERGIIKQAELAAAALAIERYNPMNPMKTLSRNGKI